MNPGYVYTARIWPPIGAALFMTVLAVGVLRHRRVPAAPPLAAGALMGVLWLLGIALGSCAVTPAAKVAWHKYQATMQLPMATATTCFVLEYVWPGRWVTRRNLALSGIPPLLVLILILANDARLFWSALEVGPGGTVVARFAAPGLILVTYGLGLVLVNVAALVWLYVRSPQHRWPAALMVAGQLAARGAYLLNFAKLALPGGLDPDVVTILIGWTTYFSALYWFRIFDPLPAARSMVLAQMRDGMLVCDNRWHILSLNPAAASALGLAAAHVRGRTLEQALAGRIDLPPLGLATGTDLARFRRGEGTSVRHFALDHQPLKDFRGLVVGHLLMLRDVTEHEHGEARLLELQWAQATLQERELLAQELHDSLSQSLAFLNLQAQTAQLYLQNTQMEDARTSLERLAAVAREMQGDTRALIGDLLSVRLPTEGFCSALRQTIARFEEQTDLCVSLEIPEQADQACDASALPPDVAIQILRIVQEALANVGKHAGQPSQTSVQLAVGDGQLRLAISDNGTGFDPSRSPGSAHGHFGLQVMRRRAAQVGGEIDIASAPDQGTRIVMRAPLRRSVGTTAEERSAT